MKLAQTVIEGSRDGYPELEEKKEIIFKMGHGTDMVCNDTNRYICISILAVLHTRKFTDMGSQGLNGQGRL